MIAANTYDNIRNWFQGCRRPLLVGHRRPDGDALGAMVAMTLALRRQELDPQPTLFEPFPQRYAMLRDLVTWRDWNRQRDELIADCDALVILDTCATSQLEPIAECLAQFPRTLVIDHHPSRDPIATRPQDLCVFDETAGAVCLIVAEWIRSTGQPLDVPMATALFVGLATDCGWFRFGNTDGRALRTASELVEAGVAPDVLFRSLYEQDPPARLRLTGRMLQSLELHAENRLAVMKIRQADFAAAGADRSMTEDLVNEANRLASTEATILFIEGPSGAVRVNLRSKTSLDVAALAARFGGGGHTRAAGARPDGAWDEVVPRVIAAAVEALST